MKLLRQLPLRLTGGLTMAGGVALLVISLLADVIGVGVNPRYFGYRQFAGSVVGMLLIVVGFTLALMTVPPDGGS